MDKRQALRDMGRNVPDTMPDRHVDDLFANLAHGPEHPMYYEVVEDGKTIAKWKAKGYVKQVDKATCPLCDEPEALLNPVNGDRHCLYCGHWQFAGDTQAPPEPVEEPEE